MRVQILPAAPVIIMPDSVKVAQRPVNPLVLVRVQVWQPFWKAGRYKLAAPVLNTDPAYAEVGALPTPSAISSSRSSIAERPVDNRKTAERYRAGRPIISL